jgi:hypothetical protein
MLEKGADVTGDVRREAAGVAGSEAAGGTGDMLGDALALTRAEAIDGCAADDEEEADSTERSEDWGRSPAGMAFCGCLGEELGVLSALDESSNESSMSSPTSAERVFRRCRQAFAPSPIRN